MQDIISATLPLPAPVVQEDALRLPIDDMGGVSSSREAIESLRAVAKFFNIERGQIQAVSGINANTIQQVFGPRKASAMTLETFLKLRDALKRIMEERFKTYHLFAKGRPPMDYLG